MANFYADENVPAPLVDALRALGHDVLTAREDGRANQQVPDPDVLARATTLGRAVLTNNRNDFHKLHRADANHAGIVTFTDDSDRAALAGRIDSSSAAALAGQLVKIICPSNPPPPVS
jgi:hypothetical protein